MGNGEQRIFVVPSLGLVVVHVAGRYNDPEADWMSERLLLNHIVPAALNREPEQCFRDPPIDADSNIWENSTKGGVSQVRQWVMKSAID